MSEVKAHPACKALFDFFLKDGFHGGTSGLGWDKPHLGKDSAPHQASERLENTQKVFSEAYAEDPALALKLLFFARDIRYGLGQRAVFRALLSWLAVNDKPTIIERLSDIPRHGRWDDLLAFLDTPAHDEAVSFLHDQFLADQKALAEGLEVSLLAKWLPSVNASRAETKRLGKILAKAFGMREKEYRKCLSALRDRIGIVENCLRKKDTDGIDYAALPARARFRYRGVFLRRDRARFGTFLQERRIIATDPWRLVKNRRPQLSEIVKKLPPPPSGRAAVPLYTDYNGGDCSTDVMCALVYYLGMTNPELYRNCFITRGTIRDREKLKWGTLDPTGRTPGGAYLAGNLADSEISYAGILELLMNPPDGRIPRGDEMPARVVYIGTRYFRTKGSITLRRMLHRLERKGCPVPRMVTWYWRKHMRGFRRGKPTIFDAAIDHPENWQVVISDAADGIHITGYNPLLLRLVMFGLTTPDEIAACGYF